MPADEVVLLQAQDPHPAPGHDGGRGQPVVPGADDDGVVIRHAGDRTTRTPAALPAPRLTVRGRRGRRKGERGDGETGERGDGGTGGRGDGVRPHPDRQPGQVQDGPRTRPCCLDPFDLEMLTEEPGVLRMIVEMMRGEDGRDNRHTGIQLDPHQPVDHSLGHKLVPVDAPVDNQGRADDGGVTPTVGQPFGVQRDLEGSGHGE